MRILIAGAGYVGCALAERLAREHEVWILRRATTQAPAHVQVVPADLRQPDTLNHLPKVDAVYFTAAADARTEDAYRAIYVDGLKNLLQAMTPCPPQRVVFTSSTAVYAQDDGSTVSEQSATEPSAATARILLEAEAWLHAQDVPATIMRLSGIYGPTRTRLIERVKTGLAWQHLEANAWTNRIHRDDCAGALAHVLTLQNPAPCYIASDNYPARFGEVAGWLARELGVQLTRPPASNDSQKRCDNSLLIQSGYRFIYPSFRDGYAPLLK